MRTSVASALTGAAAGGAPSGVFVSMPKMMGMTVTAISMMTVPPTMGVITRLSQERRQARKNWHSDETTTSVASKAAPPSTRAVTHTAMNAPEVPISRMYPAPMWPNRRACTMVVVPLTRRAANAAHVSNGSPSPAARITMAGVSTMPAMVSTAYCRPRPKARGVGGFSSAW